MKKSLIYFLVTALLHFAIPHWVSAVTKYVKPIATGSGDGSSWANASGDLQAMLRANPSEIWMAKGTYKPTVKPTGAEGIDNRDKCFYIKNSLLTIYGGFNGTETSPIQREPGLGTILSGDIGTPGNKTDNCYHVVLADSSILLQLDRIQISDGNANGFGSLTMNGYSIPRDFGGGLFLRPASGLVSYIVLGFSAFVSNSATKGSAIYDGRYEAPSNSVFYNYAYNTIFLDNEAPEGGATWYFNLQSLHIINFCTFFNNKGGALYFGESLFPEGIERTRINNCVLSPGATSTDDVVINSPSTTYQIRNCMYGIGNMPPGNGNRESNDFQFINPSNPKGPDNVLGNSDDGLRHHPDFEGINLGAATALPDSVKTDIAGNPRSFSASDAGAYERDVVGFQRWYVKAGATGKGTSWADASGNLNHIIDTASGKSNDEIWVAQGTYKPTQSPVLGDNDSRNFSFKLRSGVAMYGGFIGIETNLSQRPAGQKSTLSGDIGVLGNTSDNCHHVVISVEDSASTVLDGFQIESGNANGSGTILLEGTPVKKHQGGGLYMLGTYSTIQNAGIQYCEATYGGGMLIDGGTLALSNVAFEHNFASDDGGAVFVSAASPNFTRCSFLNNNASGMGGAFVSANATLGTSLLKCVFSQNSAERGGAINNYQSNLRIRNSVLSGNVASVDGGGINNLNSPGTKLDISNCTFYKNSAGLGGSGSGICHSSLSTGPANKITGSIFWGGNNQLQNTDGSPLSGVSYSTVDNASVPGEGNNAFSPNFVDEIDLDGPDDVFGTLDDGLRSSTTSWNTINTCNPDSNHSATDISGYLRCRIFDRGAYECLTGDISFVNQDLTPVSQNSLEAVAMGPGQIPLKRFYIENTGSPKDTNTILDIRPSGLDSSNFQIVYTSYDLVNEVWETFPLVYPFEYYNGNFWIQVTFARNSPGNKSTSILLKRSTCRGILNSKFNVIAYDKPTVGDYSPDSVQTGGQILISPSEPPKYQTKFSASASPGFKGTVVADPVSGKVRISNAHPAGTFVITLSASNPDYDSAKTFTLTVTKPSCSSGQFVNSGNFGEGNLITEAVIGDFNGDGKQDLASLVSPSGPGYISVRTGDGNGGFGIPLISEVGPSPRTLVTADFNLDGILDVATAGGSNFVSIRLGDGNGSFSGTKEIATTNPQRMATGDFNEDGFADLGVTNGIQNRVQILLGDGKGDFSEAGFAGVGLSPNDLVVSDFNNDGKADLAVSLGFGSGTTLLLGNGLGQFPTRTDITNTAESYSVSVIDFNNDGNMDWVNTNFLSNSLTVHLGNGLGGSMASFEVLVSGNAYHALAGDFNGDGFGDIASLSFVNNTIEILTGDGTGNFTPTSPLLSVPFNSSWLVTADFNGDGVTDLVCSSISSTLFLGKKGKVSVFGKGVKIEEGDNTPSTADNTDLGSVSIGQTTSKVFHIINTGTDQTTINEIRLGGSVSDMTSFSIGSSTLPRVLQMGDTLYLIVRFQPQTPTGQKTAFVEIVPNDCGQPFHFFVSGTALSGGPVASVVVSPGAGTYAGPQSVTLSTPTPGATILYTTTGNTPVAGTGFTKVYNGAFMVNNTTTVKAIATKSGMANSAVTSVVLTISNPTVVANPVITPGTGNYVGNQLITITSATADALIYYTTTGNTPVVGTGFTKLYTGPFLLAASANVKAIGMKSGFTSSAIVSVFLTITPSSPVVATPVISPGTGIYAGNQTVSISCATPGATIYYTISGNTPVLGTGFTRIYTGSFVVNKTTTVRAMATLSGSTNSAIAVSYITITGGFAPPSLSISPEPGSFAQAQTIVLDYDDPVATLYYTLDGTEPDPNSPNTFVYSGPFMLSSSATVVAIAMKNNQLHGLLDPSVYQIGAVTSNVDAREKSSITVFPNPSSSGIFQITGSEEGPYGKSFEILGTNGRSIQTGTMEKSSNEINLSAYPSGVYVLRIRNEQKVEVHRLVRQ